MNQFLTRDNFWKKYEEAKEYSSKWSKPFAEYMRIARNEPLAKVPAQYASVSDGTTAALIRKTPKRIIQQIPTGSVTSEDDNSWLPIVADFILQEKIIPYAKTDYDLIQKWWNTIENGLIVGGQAVFTPFVKIDGEFTTDATLVYYGDIFFQPGKKSFYSCDYFFIRSYWQPEMVDRVIADSKKMAAKRRKDGEKYTPAWDIKALEEIKKNITAKDEQGLTKAEEKACIEAGGIEIVTGFQKGVGAVFLTGNPTSKVIIREKTNRDPRGIPPVDYFYADTDGSNPYGRSVVELVGGLQNMIDGNMRMYMHNRALMLAPPLKVWGNSVDTTQALFEPNAIIEMGNDRNSDIVPFAVDTSAIREYASNYALIKTQIMNLFNSGGDTTVSSEVGNPGFGKTPTALKQQRAIMDTDDNYLRKNFESFFENWAETALNVYFAEREGIEELQLDQKTADKLRNLIGKNKLEAGFVSDDNKIRIDFSSATKALHFRVDASTSKMNGQAEQLETLQLLANMAATPTFAKIVPEDKMVAAWNKIVSNSGVENPEDLTVTEGQNVLAAAGDMDESQIAQYMLQNGVPENIIPEIIARAKNGEDPNQLYAEIERLLNGR